MKWETTLSFDCRVCSWKTTPLQNPLSLSLFHWLSKSLCTFYTHIVCAHIQWTTVIRHETSIQEFLLLMRRCIAFSHGFWKTPPWKPQPLANKSCCGWKSQMSTRVKQEVSCIPRCDRDTEWPFGSMPACNNAKQKVRQVLQLKFRTNTHHTSRSCPTGMQDFYTHIPCIAGATKHC